MRTVQKGFTLAELMIVIVILSILTLIAYPSYQYYVRRVRLTEVRTTLLHNAQTMERFYRQKGTFENYDQTKLEQNTYFDITLSKVSPDHFTLEANPNTAPASTDPPPEPVKMPFGHCFRRHFYRFAPSGFSNLKPAAPASDNRHDAVSPQLL